MTVAELIVKLKELEHQDAKVVVQDGSYCSEWCDVDEIRYDDNRGRYEIEGY